MFGLDIDRNTILICVCAVFIVVLLMMTLRGNKLGKEIKKARETKDIGPIITIIDEDKTADVATSFNVAIKQLWDGYDRELAMDLIHALLERNDKAPISQQWLQQALTVEPELARKQLGEEFIKAHFHEEIAQSCAGSCGSCKKCS